MVAPVSMMKLTGFSSLVEPDLAAPEAARSDADGNFDAGGRRAPGRTFGARVAAQHQHLARRRSRRSSGTSRAPRGRCSRPPAPACVAELADVDGHVARRAPRRCASTGGSRRRSRSALAADGARHAAARDRLQAEALAPRSSEMTHMPAPVSTTKRSGSFEPLTRTLTTGRLLTSSNGTTCARRAAGRASGRSARRGSAGSR